MGKNGLPRRRVAGQWRRPSRNETRAVTGFWSRGTAGGDSSPGPFPASGTNPNPISMVQRLNLRLPCSSIPSHQRERSTVMITERWQVETNAAERYEAHLVPALMDAWAPRVVAAGGVQTGDRVLDVACGTGVVARTAADRVGPSGRVVGLDLHPSMLAV